MRRAEIGGRTPPRIVEGLYSYSIGGGEVLGAALAQGFRRRGFEVVCFAIHSDDGPIKVDLERSDIRCLSISYLSRTRAVRRFTYPFAIARILRDLRPAALHVHHSTSLIAMRNGPRMARVPRTVMTEHSLHQYEEPRYLRQARGAVQYADAVVGVNPMIAQYFREHMNVRPSAVSCIQNGVAIPAIAPPLNEALRSELGVTANDFVFAFLGRLHPTKGLPTLIEAFRLLPADFRKRARLWLVGDGAERGSLEELVRRHGLVEQVRFFGARRDTGEVLRGANAMVMASVTEGAPMALLEAMALGVPCVATAVGGIPDMLGDDAGLLVQPNDPSQLAAAMHRLASSPSLRAKVLNAAHTRVRANYDLERIIDRYLEVFRLPLQWPEGQSATLLRHRQQQTGGRYRA